jgi:hypothetical protein
MYALISTIPVPGAVIEAPRRGFGNPLRAWVGSYREEKMGDFTADEAITAHTPRPTLEGVDALRLGDLALDPETCAESRL